MLTTVQMLGTKNAHYFF
jgi:hypothetical protein